MRSEKTVQITFYKTSSSQRDAVDVGEALQGANTIFAPAAIGFMQAGSLGRIDSAVTEITNDSADSFFALGRAPGIAAIFVPAVKLTADHATSGISANDHKAFMIGDALGADTAGTLSRGDKFIRAFCHELAHCLRRDDVEYSEDDARFKLLLYFTTDNGRQLTADDIEKINPDK